MARYRLGPAAWTVISLAMATLSWGGSKIVVLAGQSNMLGLGKITEMQNNHPGYLDGVTNVYYSVAAPLPDQAGYTTSPLGDIRTGLGNPCAKRDCGCPESGTFGPEAGIAKILSAADPLDKIYLLKAAKGGTNLAVDWQSDALYKNWFQVNIGSMIAEVRKIDPNASVSGFIWLQGESDATDPGYAQSYGQNLAAFIQRVRTDLGNQNLPFLYGTIRNGVFSNGTRRWPYGSVVIHAQKTLRDIPYLGCTGRTSSQRATVYALDNACANQSICSEDCNGFNNSHYDTDGQLFVGEAIGQAVVDFFSKGASSLKCDDFKAPED